MGNWLQLHVVMGAVDNDRHERPGGATALGSAADGRPIPRISVRGLDACRQRPVAAGHLVVRDGDDEADMSICAHGNNNKCPTTVLMSVHVHGTEQGTGHAGMVIGRRGDGWRIQNMDTRGHDRVWTQTGHHTSASVSDAGSLKQQTCRQNRQYG